jgi:hypothetical protein
VVSIGSLSDAMGLVRPPRERIMIGPYQGSPLPYYLAAHATAVRLHDAVEVPVRRPVVTRSTVVAH